MEASPESPQQASAQVQADAAAGGWKPGPPAATQDLKPQQPEDRAPAEAGQELLPEAAGGAPAGGASRADSEEDEFDAELGSWLAGRLQRMQPGAELTVGSVKVLGRLLDEITARVLEEARRVNSGEAAPGKTAAAAAGQAGSAAAPAAATDAEAAPAAAAAQPQERRGKQQKMTALTSLDISKVRARGIGNGSVKGPAMCTWSRNGWTVSIAFISYTDTPC